jgi:Family of unknown function (DUF6186)
MTRAVTVAGYAVIAAALAAVELTGRLGYTRSPLGGALAALTRRRAGRGLLVGLWVWLGWHLFVRAGWS